jgi:hypothetical protein
MTPQLYMAFERDDIGIAGARRAIPIVRIAAAGLENCGAKRLFSTQQQIARLPEGRFCMCTL